METAAFNEEFDKLHTQYENILNKLNQAKVDSPFGETLEEKSVEVKLRFGDALSRLLDEQTTPPAPTPTTQAKNTKD